MKAPVHILVFASTPPPHHGQSRMVQLLVEGLSAPDAERPVRVTHVNARFSDEAGEIGQVQFKKVARVFLYCAQAIRHRFRDGVRVLYYVPASTRQAAIYRDWLVMAMLRPFFPKRVYHWHASGLGEWLENQAKPWQRWITRCLLGKPDLSLVLTESGQRDAQVFGSRLTAVAPNGIPDPCPDFATTLLKLRWDRARERELIFKRKKEATNPAPRFRLLFLSLLTREKGLFDAVEAVARLNAQLAGAGTALRAELHVAGSFGSATEEQAFRERCKQGDLQEAGKPVVIFHGFVASAKKERLLGESDCLCFPTYYSAEAQPLVVIEAMAFGLPVVTSRWRSVPALLPVGAPAPVEPQQPEALARTLFDVMSAGYQDIWRGQFEREFALARFLERVREALHKSFDTGNAATAGLSFPVLGTRLSATSYDALTADCLALAASSAVTVVDFSNTHVVTLRRSDTAFRALTADIDRFVPDGMPLVWCLNRQGAGLKDRVYGPTFMRQFLTQAPATTTHYLLGGSLECGELLRQRLQAANPALRIVGSYHRVVDADGRLPDDEEDRVLRELDRLAPDFIWVGLGAPKQYAWIHRYKARLRRGVVLAVGYGFDVNAGLKKDAPAWMQRCGLTWMHRLVQEPGRLFGRYLKYNTLFVAYLLLDGLRGRSGEELSAKQRC